MNPALWILFVIIAEFLLYVATSLGKVREGLERRGVSVLPYGLLVDLGKVPRFSRAERAGEGVVKAIAVVGAAITAVLAFLFYYLLLPSAISMINALINPKAAAAPAFVPVLPGITVSMETFTVIIVVAAVAMAVHELSHALAARAAGVKVNEWGVGIFLFFPVAYVKVDEESMERADIKKKAAVLSAGVMANIALFLISVALLVPATAAIPYEGTYPVLISTVPGTPADEAGFPTPSVILSINGTPTPTVDSVKDYLMPHADENVTYVFTVEPLIPRGFGCRYYELSGEKVNVTVRKPAGGWKIGIMIGEGPAIAGGTPDYVLMTACLLIWSEIVNGSLAIINAAPIFITDGGQLLREALKRLGLEKLNIPIQATTAGLLAITLTLSLLA